MDNKKASGRFRKRSAAGFTLMEVLVAVTIFAIAAAALFVTFRTGIRSWEAGHSASELFQSARVARDVIQRDLANML